MKSAIVALLAVPAEIAAATVLAVIAVRLYERRRANQPGRAAECIPMPPRRPAGSSPRRIA